MCCLVQGITAEQLEKAALKVKSMPAHTQARWLWRMLVKEATASLSAINDEVYATLSNLEEVAVAAGVAVPPAALMLQVRSAGPHAAALRYAPRLTTMAGAHGVHCAAPACRSRVRGASVLESLGALLS
jgi:hypothetical protein